MTSILVGTSGWSYAHWDGVLYPHGLPPARRLDCYVRRFSTVELNGNGVYAENFAALVLAGTGTQTLGGTGQVVFAGMQVDRLYSNAGPLTLGSAAT